MESKNLHHWSWWVGAEKMRLERGRPELVEAAGRE
jgi:hypothetical protein